MKTYKVFSEHDAIYLAGFFDGEGYIGIDRHLAGGRYKTDRYTLSIAITNTHEGVLRWVVNTFGGCLCDQIRGNPNHARTWHWYASSVEAGYLLKAMLPFLLVKRNQAEKAIEFQDRITFQKHTLRQGVKRDGFKLPDSEILYRHSVYMELKAMKHADKQPALVVAA